jgi:hypothetical protein
VRRYFITIKNSKKPSRATPANMRRYLLKNEACASLIKCGEFRTLLGGRRVTGVGGADTPSSNLSGELISAHRGTRSAVKRPWFNWNARFASSTSATATLRLAPENRQMVLQRDVHSPFSFSSSPTPASIPALNHIFNAFISDGPASGSPLPSWNT